MWPQCWAPISSTGTHATAMPALTGVGSVSHPVPSGGRTKQTGTPPVTTTPQVQTGCGLPGRAP